MSANSDDKKAAFSDLAGDRPFIVGIDLGTTNSAVSYVRPDKVEEGKKPPIQIFNVPQLTGPGQVTRLPVLPSFLYIPGPYDMDVESIRLPWPTPEDHFVGALAREQGARVPGRLVSSAKSWLSHGNVDRNARILPWGAPPEVRKVSPVAASAAYLEHIKRAWNHARGDEEELFLENQAVILTVPASFDEVARELTLSAARMAGYKHVTLLEEPLAAFYSWLIGHERQWDRFVAPGELILICDVGGGTTDFTLVTLSAAEGGSPRFERIAVGDHLLLGGDNMDLALARRVETQWAGQRASLSTNRWKALCHQARQAKEAVLSGSQESHRITLMGAGSRLIAGTMTAELDRGAIESTILDGFFPIITAETPAAAAQRPAITEFGLPYEPEPAVTRHLVRFLQRHRQDAAQAVGKDEARPDLILFNGGALKPKVIRDRIVEAVRAWFKPQRADEPRVLDNPDPDLAVALGAAYYGLVKVGRGVRVGSGSPRSYYLGIARDENGAQAAPEAICLVERGLDEGSSIELSDKRFEVLANQPVRFTLFSSSYRGGDRSGQVVAVDDTFTALPPLQTVIQYGKKGVKTSIPVTIAADYTEIGTLALWCRSLISEHRWQLSFQLRDSGAPTAVKEETVLEAAVIEEARRAVREAFNSPDSGRLPGLVKDISALVQLGRDEWPLRLIRDLADQLLEDFATRSLSVAHETRWMNLAGFCLRPGFGDALDPQRIKQAWKIHSQGMAHPNQAQVQTEWWVLWRRAAGGLNPGQQRQLSQEATPVLSPRKGAKVRLAAQQQLEIWMAVANLERLYVKDKIQWGRLLLSQMSPGQARHQHFWCLARIGARELLYGPADRVVPPQEAAEWIGRLLDGQWPQTRALTNALVQLGRKTGDRTRDLDQKVIERILARLSHEGAGEEQLRSLREVVRLEKQEERDLFGDSLPSGIVLREDT